jgi:CheY-like chemotaxis protein
MAARQKILILDDEHDILEIYQEILARLPSQPEIHTADNGARAIALLESEAFNLLLVDLRMPTMDGFQVLAIVRRKFPALRVVVMTAAEDEQFRARAYAMGIDLYIEKPKTGKEIINFVDCIESLLEREEQGGFRGVQSKTLVDIVQLECLTQSSAILKITTATDEGRIWVQRGEIIDAATGDLREGSLSRDAPLADRQFRDPPSDIPRPRTIFTSYESLLMETAQTLDESSAAETNTEAVGLAAFARYKGVQFALGVETANETSLTNGAAKIPTRWRPGFTTPRLPCTSSANGSKLVNSKGASARPAAPVACSSATEALASASRVRRAASHRETMKQIEAKWVS